MGVAAIADLHHSDDEFAIDDLVENSIVALSQAVFLVACGADAATADAQRRWRTGPNDRRHATGARQLLEG